MKALIIDDDLDFGNLMTQILNELNIENIFFEKPELAINEIKKYDPNFIFLDYEMPRMKGDQFLIRFSELKIFDNRRIFLVTGTQIDKNYLKTLKVLGVEKILYKPIQIKDIEEAIKSND